MKKLSLLLNGYISAPHLLGSASFGVVILSILSMPFMWQILVSQDQGALESESHSFYQATAFDTPENLSLAGEPVPLYDPDIQERLDRELLVNTYWHSQTFLFFKRANKWFPVIEPIFEEYGIPDDFKYMALIESGLTNAVSPAGAAGFWQLMERTGKEYGLIVNNEVDERYNVEKSTRVAAEYLLKAYEEFGNWTLAAASYNMGITGVKRVQERQNIYSYYDMALNPETARFVYRILAVKEIFENPRKYGFNFEENQLYQPVDVRIVKVDHEISDWVKFAEEHNITYKTLRSLNPWIRSSEMRNRSGDTFEVSIPNNPMRDTVSVNIPAGEKFSDARERKQRLTGTPHRELTENNYILHKVKQAETIATIAEKYQVEKSSILQWNELSSADGLKPGAEIKIIENIE